MFWQQTSRLGVKTRIQPLHTTTFSREGNEITEITFRNNIPALNLRIRSCSAHQMCIIYQFRKREISKTGLVFRKKTVPKIYAKTGSQHA